MNNNLTKIVTLIPSATEIVAFLGQKNSIVGRSHECDYPNDLNNVIKLTSPKINVEGTSSEINKQIHTILENSLSVYKVNIEKLKELDPDFIITQAHCDVCAVNFSEVKNIVNKYFNRKTKIISLEPNTLNDVFNDIKRVAKDLNIENETNNKLINNLKIRIEKIIKINDNVRLPKSYHRFVGLVEQLFSEKSIQSEGNILLEIMNMKFSELIKKINPKNIVGLSRLGKTSSYQQVAQSLDDDSCIIIGGFQKGHFSNLIISKIDQLVNIDSESLEAHVVTARILYEYEKTIFK